MAHQATSRTIQEVADAVSALGKLRDDRSVAIMGAALVEYQLGRAILNRLVEMKSKEQNSLLDNNGHGAIASFSAKIWMGFAIGLYDPDERSDLLKIKDIRNKFAHTDLDLWFGDPGISKLCGGLNKLACILRGYGKKETDIPRDRYLNNINHFASLFQLNAEPSKRHIPPPPAKLLF
jgi:hypothetical protein